MPRTYKRKPGAGPYLTTYSAKQMDKAILDVKSGKSIQKSAFQNGVPRTTLSDRMKNLHSKRHGGQLYLNAGFETAVVKVLDQLSSWKHPLTTIELRRLVKNYLNLCGVRSQFKDNLPGRDWAKNFIKRHSLTERVPTKIRPKRAELTKEDIENFFANLTGSLDGVEPGNIYNYDETNFTDDPKAGLCICRPGRRRHERVMEHSKMAFSVMFCGNATGEHLPPMIVYKAKHMYEGWRSDAIPGAVYESTESGWFDMKTFDNWFFQIFLPHVKDKNGPKVMIGDNLASHFSPRVIDACLEHGIRFVTLPPNSTHICQPLDVAVFRPMKVLWRTCLTDWRNESRSKGSIPKEIFPQLLNRVFKQLKTENLISGFRATGICPLDSSPFLQHVAKSGDPENPDDMNMILSEACVQLLSEDLGKTTGGQKRPKRGRKVEPGKAVCPPDVYWCCDHCKEMWDDDDPNQWVVCDVRTCNLAFHLQCSGIDYDKDEYWDLDLENLTFLCEACNTKKRRKNTKNKKKGGEE